MRMKKIKVSERLFVTKTSISYIIKFSKDDTNPHLPWSSGRIPACHAGGSGSIPDGRGILLLIS
jgi:hypothetical protein